MQHLIDDLLTYARVSGKKESFVMVDLNRVMEGALQDLSAAITEAGATIEVAPLPAMRGSASLLMHCFENLISNAIKFRAERKPLIQIGCKSQNNHWIFSVKDNGIGIKKEFWEKIFIIFQRLHNRDQYPGTGIGLAICKKIVETHGGRIWIDSIPGEGTTFYFTFPRVS